MNSNCININRGNKYTNYSKKIPIDKPKYDGDIFEKIPHNKVIGKFVDVLENVGRYNQNMYIIDSDRTDGLFDKVFGYTSLDRQMKEVNIDDIIEIEYIGLKKNGIKEYHEFKVSKLYY